MVHTFTLLSCIHINFIAQRPFGLLNTVIILVFDMVDIILIKSVLACIHQLHLCKLFCVPAVYLEGF